MLPKVGISISTLNRRELFNKTVEQYRRFTPSQFPIIVIDDGSDIPVPLIEGVTVIRNPAPTGVARVKNQGIAALMDLGVDHLILSDDDCYPIEDDWWQDYVHSGEAHLSLQLRWTEHCSTCRTITMWTYNTTKGYPTCDVCQPGQAIYEDDNIHAVAWGSGVFLYFTKECINRIGGMRTEYGRYGVEHWDIATRAVNAGLIRYPFQDVIEPRLHAVDAHSTGVRSCVPQQERRELLARNWELFETKFKNSKDFVPYIEPSVTDIATICIPRRDTHDRVDAHERCHQFWTEHGFTVVSADSDGRRGFNCSQARNNAIKRATTDVVIVADADTLPDSIDQIRAAVDRVTTGQADMVYPYTEYRHIDAKWALKDDFTAAPVQQSYPDSPGGIFVTTKAFHNRCGGFDERFPSGVTDNGSCFGFDDTAFRCAAETLGTVDRIPGICWSFNHATNPDGKPDRDWSTSNPSKARYELYKLVCGKPELMAELVRR